MGLRVRCRLGCSSPHPSPRAARPDPPAGDLVWLPLRVPLHARRRRPQSVPGVPERAPGRRFRASGHGTVGAVAPEHGRVVEPAPRGDVAHVLALAVHRPRARPALGLPLAQRELRPASEHDPARERDRAHRLRVDADRPTEDVSGARLRRHARQLRDQPQQRDRARRREPVCGDAQPPRGGLADHRRRVVLHRPLEVGESALAPLAVLGLVLGDGDRQPLLARHRRRNLRRECRWRGRQPQVPAAALLRPTRPSLTAGSLKEAYTAGVRRAAARWMAHLARTPISPDALTFAGVTICAVASVVVYFEYVNELLCFWLGAALFVIGSVLDILDGALARSSGKGTTFGAFLDSTTDRIGEAFMLGAIALVFSRDGNQVALAFAFAAVVGSFLVSYTRARAEALGLKGDVGIGSRAERVVVIVTGLVLAPWGVLPWAIYLLTATAWITVVQRVLAVRSQLRER